MGALSKHTAILGLLFCVFVCGGWPEMRAPGEPVCGCRRIVRTSKQGVRPCFILQSSGQTLWGGGARVLNRRAKLISIRTRDDSTWQYFLSGVTISILKTYRRRLPCGCRRCPSPCRCPSTNPRQLRRPFACRALPSTAWPYIFHVCQHFCLTRWNGMTSALFFFILF